MEVALRVKGPAERAMFSESLKETWLKSSVQAAVTRPGLLPVKVQVAVPVSVASGAQPTALSS